jgi:predicted DCC family thiol-disulfide oxidoreductase YuxK
MLETESKIKTGAIIVLYDGVCGLCNQFVQFVLKRDPERKFLFASLQSDFAYRALSKHSCSPRDLNTVFVIVDYGRPNERLLVRAKAALYVLSKLGNGFCLLGLCNLVPAPILDLAYNLVAKNRYRWFGKFESCFMPDSNFSERFIEV